MVSLDFALLAEYARVDPAGLVTIVGGGFDRVHAPAAGAVQQMFVAVRFILDEDEPAVPFEVKIQTPGDQYEIGIAGVATRAPAVQPIEGKVNFVAAIGLAVQLRTAGRYLVQILLAGEVVRRLPFLVEFAHTEST